MHLEPAHERGGRTCYEGHPARARRRNGTRSPVTDLKIQVAEAVTSVADVVQNVAGQTNEAALVERLRAVNLATQAPEQALGLSLLKDGSQLPEDSSLGTPEPRVRLVTGSGRCSQVAKSTRSAEGGRRAATPSDGHDEVRRQPGKNRSGQAEPGGDRRPAPGCAQSDRAALTELTWTYDHHEGSAVSCAPEH